MKNKKPLVFELTPAKNQPAKSLIVLFHGHGGNAGVFRHDIKQLSKALPDSDFISLEGPEQILGEDDNYKTWLKLNSVTSLPKIALRLTFNRVPIIDQINLFLDDELRKRNLTNDKLGLLGFSFGGGVALTVAMARKEKCAGVVSHSGVFYRYPHAKSRPDTLVIMGDADYLYLMPNGANKGRLKQAFHNTLSLQHDHSMNRLRKSGIVFEERIIKGLEHTTNKESLRHSADFFKRKLS